MSDFGANIFDDEPPAHRESPAPKDPPAPPDRHAANPAPPVPPAPRANAPQQQPRPAPPAPPREPRREPEPPPEHGRDPGRGPGRHTAFRPASQGHHRPDSDVDRKHPPERAETPRHPQRADVAVLVDLDALQAEARAQRGELAMQRLRHGLGGERTVQRAIAFASTNVTPPAGFELLVASPGTGLADGVRFAATAIELLAAAGALVLAPPSAANRQLAKALRAAGHLVDLAGFDATAASGEPMRVLGRDCLFVP